MAATAHTRHPRAVGSLSAQWITARGRAPTPSSTSRPNPTAIASGSAKRASACWASARRWAPSRA
eukprot:10399998-Alexandrium_andersonii.AAC.1